MACIRGSIPQPVVSCPPFAMTRDTWKAGALLFGSGFCALVYQTVWLRQFRLIFGASTSATAAVLAIFMAGLGFGSALPLPYIDVLSPAPTLAETLAGSIDEQGLPYIESLRHVQPIEGDALMARLQEAQSRPAEAAAYLQRALVAYRTNPWPSPSLMGRALDSTPFVVRADRATAPILYDALSSPFAAGQWNDARRVYRVAVAREGEGCGPHTAAALNELEPNVPWRSWLLELRRDCYSKTNPGSYDEAVDDYNAWLAAEPMPIDRGVR